MHNYNFACCFIRVLNMVSLTLRDEYRLRVFENGILRKVFGCNGNGITGDRRLLHSGELCNVTSHQILTR